MYFNSYLFIFLFVPITLLGYYTLNHFKKYRPALAWVVFASLVFYSWANLPLFFLIASSIAGNFICSLLMKKTGKNKRFGILGIIFDLGLLFYFKYYDFFISNMNAAFGLDWALKHIALPMGISFYTFQQISYMADRMNGKADHYGLLDYMSFVTFFPQLVAGPIVRASDFIPQMYRTIKVTREMLGLGFWFVITGLFKKAVISDYISVNFVERVFDTPMQFSGLENLLGAYGYGLQIYCDFSGYSDMAIGLALLMGFRFNINFNNPYKAVSITDFWHRWHISLSTWLRDYLYISLGGNRKGRLRQYLNLFVTMLLGGLWHGASLNFVMWGALHGIALVVHKMWMGITAGAKWVNSRWWRALMVLVTFHFVIFAWLLFRNADVTCKGLFLAGDWGNLGVMLTQIFTNFHPELFVDVLTSYWHVFSLIVLGYVLHFVPDRFSQRCKRAFVRMPVIVYALVLIVVIVAIIQVKTSEIQPFIYFQF